MSKNSHEWSVDVTDASITVSHTPTNQSYHFTRIKGSNKVEPLTNSNFGAEGEYFSDAFDIAEQVAEDEWK